jgi:G3E family GTPase
MTEDVAATTELLVLTGFLGTGKTTLLSDFLVQPEAADTAVIINEAGEINIDGAIVAETGRALPVALLSNGCVCCSVANDLLYTIEALVEGRRDAGQPPFRRIVLECSGLAQPGAVLRSLAALGPLQMPIRILATIDANGSSLDAGFEDAVAQLAAAQTIVLTKLDHPPRPDRVNVRTRLSLINPLARIVEIDDPRERARAAFRPAGDAVPLKRTRSVLTADPGFGHPRVMTALARFSPPPPWPDLEEWLENLAGFCGTRLLRLKGIVPVAESEEPVLIQAVGTLFSTPRRMARRDPATEGLVIIARDLLVTALRGADLGLNVRFSGTGV